MVGEWLGVDDGWRRTKSYWWSGGFAANRQARPDAAKRPVITRPTTQTQARRGGAGAGLSAGGFLAAAVRNVPARSSSRNS
jgi:hypothetical protein